MSWNYTDQKTWGVVGGRIEHGKIAFGTTDLSVEVTTRLTRIFSAQVTTITDVGTLVETYFCDKVVTGGAVTIERRLKTITLPALADDAVHVSTYVWALVPVGYSPVAGAINGMRVYNLTNDDDTTSVVLLGKVNNNVVLIDTTGATDGFIVGEEVAQATDLARGVVISYDHNAGSSSELTVRTLEGVWGTGEITGADGALTPNTHVPDAAEPSFFIDAGNAWLMPEDAHFLDIQAGDITVGDAANKWTSTTVAAGDLLLFGSVSGGSVAPSGLRVEVDILPTPTSGTEVSYALMGQ